MIGQQIMREVIGPAPSRFGPAVTGLKLLKCCTNVFSVWVRVLPIGGLACEGGPIFLTRISVSNLCSVNSPDQTMAVSRSMRGTNTLPHMTDEAAYLVRGQGHVPGHKRLTAQSCSHAHRATAKSATQIATASR